MSKKRRQHSAQFKAQVGLDALKGIEPVHALAAKHGVHPGQISQWKKEVCERLPEVFAGKPDQLNSTLWVAVVAQPRGIQPVTLQLLAGSTALSQAVEPKQAQAPFLPLPALLGVFFLAEVMPGCPGIAFSHICCRNERISIERP